MTDDWSRGEKREADDNPNKTGKDQIELATEVLYCRVSALLVHTFVTAKTCACIAVHKPVLAWLAMGSVSAVRVVDVRLQHHTIYLNYMYFPS